VGLARGGVRLAPGARIGGERGLRFTIGGMNAPGEEELLELLRARIERRFRP
jgi:hypothetical protein